MSPAEYRTTKNELRRSLVLHRAELDQSLQTLGQTARVRVDPRAIVARRPYVGLLAFAALGYWLGSR